MIDINWLLLNSFVCLGIIINVAILESSCIYFSLNEVLIGMVILIKAFLKSSLKNLTSNKLKVRGFYRVDIGFRL